MALFIEVQVASALASDATQASKLAEVCPVGIFKTDDGGALQIVDENVDECTLCELCLGVGEAGQVTVKKLYDDGKVLERSA